MNLEIKEKWIAALRSGDFTQGRGNLARINTDKDNEYCCLGVLCELHVQEDPSALEVNMDTVGDDGVRYEVKSYNQMSLVLPEATRRWADIDNGNPDTGILYRDRYNQLDTYHLAPLNDSGLTFDQIADVIEYAF